MSFERFRQSQGDAVDFFLRATGSGRLAHAYLFLGPAGVGKASFARELARFLFCKDRDSARDSCGVCRNCTRLRPEIPVNELNFPDLHWFERPADKRDIPIELMRDMQKELSLKPVEGPWKVFVISEAERLNEASANCILKILEEPPPHSLLILLANEADDMLPTILSRVHVIRFKPMPTEKLAKELISREKASPEGAHFLARLSGGSPGQARKLLEAGYYPVHCELLERVRAMKPEENFDVSELLRSRVKDKKASSQQEREAVCAHLEGLMLGLRDGLGSGSTEADVAGMQRAIGSIMEAHESITANCNIRLALENMFFEVACSLRKTL